MSSVTGFGSILDRIDVYDTDIEFCAALGTWVDMIECMSLSSKTILEELELFQVNLNENRKLLINSYINIYKVYAEQETHNQN